MVKMEMHMRKKRESLCKITINILKYKYKSRLCKYFCVQFYYTRFIRNTGKT